MKNKMSDIWKVKVITFSTALMNTVLQNDDVRRNREMIVDI